MNAAFELYAFRFRFAACDAVHFPAGKSGNIIRGAFGTLFREIAAPDDYSRLFEPQAREPGPSGLADRPRAFVFRAAHLDGSTYQPGEPFHFDVHIFDVRDPAAGCFVSAFSRLAETGLGPGRGRARLTGAEQLNNAGDSVARIGERLAPPIRIDLSPREEEIRRILVRFLTPTELKDGERLAERPEFPILFCRARDRVSTLRGLYGPGPLEIDFRGMGERAAAVRMTACDVDWRYIERRSSRTGRTHPIGGFTGEAEYEGPAGELGEFAPFLEAARWTGVGRQTVWGKGVIETVVSSSTPR